MKSCDLLFYRPRSLFGRSIALYDAIVHILRPKIFFRVLTKKGFSHVGAAIRSPKGPLKRFDACENMKTGFREEFGQCYVFRLNLDVKQKRKFSEHMLSREGSSYDRKGILNFILPHLVSENEFEDFCSELIKNALLLTGNFDDLSGIQPTPLQLFNLLRDRLTFVGLLIH